ncbi:MAG: 50S ribosomal protein L11 methyltransferase [Phaeodactylibacter sp.]|nr:50S ribosomal protein L11 methyltransferase [Phaeodactylibacter sp.]MCB9050162.1 50S ribosomal protein L11 methyltransferase [Lewinellaceae bacterium]
MDYYCYDIKVAPSLREIALAFLSELPFDTFEETDDGLHAYLRMDNTVEDIEDELANIAAQLSFTFERRLIPSQNWNELWESNFTPIKVDNRCGVRAHFHPPMEDVRYEIVISPRMAFGTGHHATTYMMLERMSEEDFEGLKVLDYGCGTGILAILADKMGAAQIDAVDVEQAAYENTLDNAQDNGASHIQAFHGTLEVIKDAGYGYILANINRNVILNSLKALYGKLAPGGILLVSGILTADESLVLERAAAEKFHFTDKVRRGDWSCIRFVR